MKKTRKKRKIYKGEYIVTYKTKAGTTKSKVIDGSQMNKALKKLRENKNVELYFYEEKYVG